jgi:hypothetical protein
VAAPAVQDVDQLGCENCPEGGWSVQPKRRRADDVARLRSLRMSEELGGTPFVEGAQLLEPGRYASSRILMPVFAVSFWGL